MMRSPFWSCLKNTALNNPWAFAVGLCTNRKPSCVTVTVIVFAIGFYRSRLLPTGSVYICRSCFQSCREGYPISGWCRRSASPCSRCRGGVEFKTGKGWVVGTTAKTVENFVCRSFGSLSFLLHGAEYLDYRHIRPERDSNPVLVGHLHVGLRHVQFADALDFPFFLDSGPRCRLDIYFQRFLYIPDQFEPGRWQVACNPGRTGFLICTTGCIC